MWGDGLLISPVLSEGDNTVKAYLPEGQRWYDLHKVTSQSSSSYCDDGWLLQVKEVTEEGEVTLEAPIKIIPLHVRGGVIIPQQQADLTTNARWVWLYASCL